MCMCVDSLSVQWNAGLLTRHSVGSGIGHWDQDTYVPVLYMYMKYSHARLNMLGQVRLGR